MTPYHAWLIRQRIYCERGACYAHATHVRQFNGAEIALCAEHAARLDAVRQSEKKQETQPK